MNESWMIWRVCFSANDQSVIISATDVPDFHVTYTAPGEYLLACIYTDPDGLSATATTTIDVQQGESCWAARMCTCIVPYSSQTARVPLEWKWKPVHRVTGNVLWVYVVLWSTVMSCMSSETKRMFAVPFFLLTGVPIFNTAKTSASNGVHHSLVIYW